MKRVQVTIELSTSFVQLLHAKCAMCDITGWLTGADDVPKLDPAGVLALIVLAEARGELADTIDMATPPEWRNDIHAVHSQRNVIT